ncbi:MAG: hypothetical protein ACH34X_17445 [Thiolinea sp.]
MTEPNAPLQALQALPSLPNQAIIPTRLVVPEAQWQHLIKRLTSDGQPTPALVALMAGFKLSHPATFDV